MAVGSWVVYDIANTVFWTGVVGLAFPLWVTKGLDDVPSGIGGDDATLGYTLAATMMVVLVLAPVLGAISDQWRRRTPLLAVTTLASVGATLTIGNGSLVFSLAFFALALATMELGTIFYNALLTEVSTEANRGTVAGLGIGIGYLGAFMGVAAALIFSEARGYVFTFRVVASLFLLFALPIFLFLGERPREVRTMGLRGKINQGFLQLARNLRSLQGFPGLRPYLAGRFLYSIGINTTTAFAVVFASQTVGLSDREIELILLAGIAVAIPSGAISGRVIDRIGPQRVLTSSLLVWVGLLLFAVVIPWFNWSVHLWWIVGCVTGAAIAGVFSADRPYMLTFTPPQYLGEFFGIHAMVGKSGRVLGPFMWALISSTIGLGQLASILSLVVCLAGSYAILRSLKAPVGSPAADIAD